MKKIIFVEDDEPTRDALQIAFRIAGLQLINFANADQLINHRIDAPDLFLMDNQLPGVKGLELCRFIKENRQLRHVPVIIMSATTNIEAQARAARAQEVSAKPFSLRQLRETLARCIRN